MAPHAMFEKNSELKENYKENYILVTTVEHRMSQSRKMSQKNKLECGTAFFKQQKVI